MAIQIISSNYNVYGNTGTFEGDPTTWGFGFPGNGLDMDRSSLYSHQGLSSVRFKKQPNRTGAEYAFGRLAQANFRMYPGKYYTFRAWVYVPVSNPLLDDDLEILIPVGTDPNVFFTPILEQRKTVLQCKGVWQQIESRVLCTLDPVTYSRGINITIQTAFVPDGIGINIDSTFVPFANNVFTYNLLGELFIDQIEIFEYANVEGCDIDLDEDNTVVINESTPLANDGSIELAVIGGDGPFEYSKDDGVTWQVSNLFEALSSGVYRCKVREIASPACISGQSFTVNSEAPDFSFSITVDNETLPGENDGRVEVTVDGETGPYLFSKDGGVTWQSSDEFTDLAPGDYVIVVKDSNDVIQATTVTVLAGTLVYDKAYFSRNPIPFSKGALEGWEELDNYRVYCDTRVEEESGSGVFVSALKQELEPDTNGNVVFQLRQAFRNILRAIPTERSDGVIILTDRIKLFKNYTGHLEGDEVTPVLLTASSPYLVILGGIDKLNYPGLNYLSTYLTANKKFMTWAPIEKEVDALQEDYLSFFIYRPLINVISVYYKIYYDDNTDFTVNPIGGSGFIQGQLIQIPSGPANTSVLLFTPEKNVVKYEVWLQDQNDNLITEVRTYVMAPYHHPLTRFLMILNSLGAWEVHKFTGQAELSEAYDRTVVQKHLPHDYESLDGEMEVRDVSSSAKRSYSSGFIKGKYAADWMIYMREVARAKMMYEINANGTRIPLMNLTREFVFKRDQDYERFVRIEAQEVYSNESFTPEL